MELMSPRRRTFSVNAHDVNWVPWSEWTTVSGDVVLDPTADRRGGRQTEVAAQGAMKLARTS
jgi:hypothetical protein